MKRKPPVKPRGPSASGRRTTGILSLFTPVNVILLLLALGGAVAAAVSEFGSPAAPPRSDSIVPSPPISNGLTWEGTAVGSTLPLFKATPPTRGLPPPGPGVRIPVNNTDLFTGKPTTFSSPVKIHKGYSVAFCCDQSAGYNGGWDGLTEAEKDTYVRSFLQ